MDNNNLNETPVQDVQETPVQETPVQNVQETVEQAEQVTYSYTDTAAEEGTTEGGGKTQQGTRQKGGSRDRIMRPAVSGHFVHLW